MQKSNIWWHQSFLLGERDRVVKIRWHLNLLILYRLFKFANFYLNTRSNENSSKSFLIGSRLFPITRGFSEKETGRWISMRQISLYTILGVKNVLMYEFVWNGLAYGVSSSSRASGLLKPVGRSIIGDPVTNRHARLALNENPWRWASDSVSNCCQLFHK